MLEQIAERMIPAFHLRECSRTVAPEGSPGQDSLALFPSFRTFSD